MHFLVFENHVNLIKEKNIIFDFWYTILINHDTLVYFDYIII